MIIPEYRCICKRQMKQEKIGWRLKHAPRKFRGHVRVFFVHSTML